jgi:hypothetical protein
METAYRISATLIDYPQENQKQTEGTSKTVASGSSFSREAQPYGRTVSIAGGKCDAQQVFRGARSL